ncbi:MAG: hypothetical protein AAFU85_27290 [Planctomycetota bacterium]
MNNRILLVVTTAAVLSTSTGCGVFRNFLFGRGARCGLCNRLSAPAQQTAPAAIPAAPTCNTPTYVQPQQPQAHCGCNNYVPANPCDPYLTQNHACGPVGSGAILGDAPIYGDGFQPRSQSSLRPSVDPYAQGYKVDNDGARIIHEDPLPPGAMAVQ